MLMKNDILSAAAILMALSSSPVVKAGETASANRACNVRTQECIAARCSRSTKRTEDYVQSFFREDEPVGNITERKVEEVTFFNF